MGAGLRIPTPCKAPRRRRLPTKAVPSAGSRDSSCPSSGLLLGGLHPRNSPPRTFKETASQHRDLSPRVLRLGTKPPHSLPSEAKVTFKERYRTVAGCAVVVTL